MTKAASDSNPGAGESVLLTTTSDTEAELVRQILLEADIPCRVTAEVPHSVLPLSVDGLGEVRILVPDSALEQARELVELHRQGGD